MKRSVGYLYCPACDAITLPGEPRDIDAVTFNDRCWRRLGKNHFTSSVEQMALPAPYLEYLWSDLRPSPCGVYCYIVCRKESLTRVGIIRRGYYANK